MSSNVRSILVTLAMAATLIAGLALPVSAAAAQEAPPAPQAPPADAPPPEGDGRKKVRLIVGPEFGVFLPTSGKAGDAFGTAWTNLGVGVGRVRGANPRGAFAFEFQVLRNRRGGSRALLLPLTVTYRRGLLPPGRGAAGARPYVGLGTGLYLADLRSEKYGVTSGFRGTIGVTALAGATVGDRAVVEARYLAVGRVKGFDLSGVNLTAGFRF